MHQELTEKGYYAESYVRYHRVVNLATPIPLPARGEVLVGPDDGARVCSGSTVPVFEPVSTGPDEVLISYGVAPKFFCA